MCVSRDREDGAFVNTKYLVFYICKGKKVKSSMAKSLPVENLLPQNVGSIINYLR